jgi:hypothetical protein
VEIESSTKSCQLGDPAEMIAKDPGIFRNPKNRNQSSLDGECKIKAE